MLQSNLLRGERVRLTAVSPADLPTLSKWWADADFLRLYDSVPAYPQTEAQLQKRIEEGQKGERNFLFGIRPLAADDLIGLVELDGIMWSHGTTFVSIAIGAANNRGKGYGREAMRLALYYAFRELNLHRVCLTVFNYNEAAVKLYEGLGFVREGVYREHLQRDGRRYDMILYGLLRREWDSLVQK
ncbi:MAG: GNAT family N-acetyltransferase [Chloroflexi bacterium]|nr:GNAT family N-acetyltransferase [Chloroflexota bacterium]